MPGLFLVSVKVGKIEHDRRQVGDNRDGDTAAAVQVSEEIVRTLQVLEAACGQADVVN